MFRFHPEEIQDDEEEKDIVKAIPMSARLRHGHFDTVVVITKDEAESTGLHGGIVFLLSTKVKLTVTLQAQELAASKSFLLCPRH